MVDAQPRAAPEGRKAVVPRRELLRGLIEEAKGTRLPAGAYSFTAVASDERGGSTTSAAVTVNAPPTSGELQRQQDVTHQRGCL
jgi:hypothetical protein